MTTINDRGLDQIHIDAYRPQYRRVFGDTTASYVTVLSSAVGSGVGFYIESLYFHNADTVTRRPTYQVVDASGGNTHVFSKYVLVTLLDHPYPEQAQSTNFHMVDRRYRFLRPGDALQAKNDGITVTAVQYMVIFQEFNGLPEGY